VDKQIDRELSRAIGIIVRAGAALEFLLAFLLVIPLTLWLAWARHSTIAEPVVLILFSLSFAWGNVSVLKWQRSFRKLGWSSTNKLAFGLGPRPEDPDELHLWQWGRHFCYSFAAILLCMVAFAIIKWLQWDY
jgi:hypothetical protein